MCTPRGRGHGSIEVWRRKTHALGVDRAFSRSCNLRCLGRHDSSSGLGWNSAWEGSRCSSERRRGGSRTRLVGHVFVKILPGICRT